MSSASGAPLLLAAGAVKSALEALLRDDAAWRGPRPRVEFGTVGALRDRVLAGETPAVAVLSAEAMETLVARGRAVPDGVVALGRASIGLARHDGVPARPIDTLERFRDALLAARSVGWAGGAHGATAGRHFEHVLDTLGIAAAVRSRGRVFAFGVEAVAACGRGEVELAVSQGTEIVGRPGVSLLGSFPVPHGLSTRYAAAALSDTEQARAILDTLSSQKGRDALRASGFEEA